MVMSMSEINAAVQVAISQIIEIITLKSAYFCGCQLLLATKNKTKYPPSQAEIG